MSPCPPTHTISACTPPENWQKAKNEMDNSASVELMVRVINDPKYEVRVDSQDGDSLLICIDIAKRFRKISNGCATAGGNCLY
jgi:hypothetical protein